MTPQLPRNEFPLPEVNQQLAEMLRDAVDSTTKRIGGDLENLQQFEPNSADATTLSHISEMLFTSADTLIYLAEAAQAAEQRIRRHIGTKAVQETSMLPQTELDTPEKKLTFKVQTAISKVLAATTQPIIHTASIVNAAHGSNRIDKTTFNQLVQEIQRDGRLLYMQDAQYLVADRDKDADWINVDELKDIANAAIVQLLASRRLSMPLSIAAKKFLPSNKQPLVHQEIAILRQLLNDDPRIDSESDRMTVKISDSAAATKDRSTDLDAKLTSAGMVGRVQPYRRR